MHRNKTGKTKLTAAFLLFAASAIIGLTGATILHQLTLQNPIKTPTVEGKITEDNNKNYKNAIFENTGEANVFLRVSFSESWTYQQEGKEKIILPNEGLVNTQSDPAAKPSYESKPIAVPNWNNRADWVEGNDGWWYYKKVLLNKDEGTRDGKTDNKTSQFVKEVNFDNVNKAKDERYKDAEYQLHFTMEVVQCSDQKQVSIDAVEALFKGKTVELSGDWPTSRTFTWKDKPTGQNNNQEQNDQTDQKQGE